MGQDATIRKIAVVVVVEVVVHQVLRAVEPCLIILPAKDISGMRILSA